MTLELKNTTPIDASAPGNQDWLSKLQGNILSGHGRDHTIHLFVSLPALVAGAKALVVDLARSVTSAHQQELERQEFNAFDIPGSLFRSLHLSANGYRKLGFEESDLQKFRKEEEKKLLRGIESNFLDGMTKHAVSDFGDPAPALWDKGFRTQNIDLMLLLADDDIDFLAREARRVIDSLVGRCELIHVERGSALRNNQEEGIEHFGYVDGRSQPLFLASDFEKLEAGGFGPDTREKGGGGINVWNPFEPLELILTKDHLTSEPDCFGSFLVFRKLEQNVRDFTVAEQRLADSLTLEDQDRARAGAMAVGRFRDGTPLVLSKTDGFIPAKDNNFRYDDPSSTGAGDAEGARCPIQAHIRKTNPRGDIGTQFGVSIEEERKHRIARRAIPYGKRDRHPDAFNAVASLPSKGVGLLFMCYQASIPMQFAFIQRGWANNQDFVKNGAGLDPVIGQLDQDKDTMQPVAPVAQSWRPQYGDTAPDLVEAPFSGFVTMKGGEFFFTPSIPFLRSLV